MPVLSYILSARTQKEQPLYCGMAQTTQKTRVTCQDCKFRSVSSAGRGADDIENTASSIVACWTVITEMCLGNTIKSVALLFYYYYYYFVLCLFTSLY
jgi:hypothetical protein